MANDPTARSQAAEHVEEELSFAGVWYKPDSIEHNLQFASPGEIVWATSANAASIRAAARMPADRYTPQDNVPVNPFWYHAFIDAQ